MGVTGAPDVRPTLSAAESARNVRVSAAVSFVGFTGFTFVMPFLPLYIAELGVTDVGEVAMWTGLTLGATPAVTAISAPLWGRVGDRYGSKLLVLRSLGAFVLTKAAMAFVTAAWQLFALRALLGLFAGYGALTVSMAAESVPRHEMPRAIGFVQTGQRLGPALGPVLGGLLAPLVGLRRSFLIAALFYVAAIVLVAVAYREPRRRHASSAAVRVPLATVLRLEHFPLFLLVILGFMIVDRSFSPILPIYIEQSGVPAARVPIVTGLLFSVAAFSAAAGHHFAGRLIARWTTRRVIVRGALVAAVALVPFMQPSPIWLLVVATLVFGVVVGLAMTAAYAAGGALIPPEAHTTGFGFMTSASLVGLAVSPIAAGFVGARSLTAVFVVDFVIMLGMAVLVRRRLSAER
ncbi:MAG: MFS transporter [Vicinamibacterales bacterium]|nr:MFS transporter [Vicinamibacterales bacterium]